MADFRIEGIISVDITDFVKDMKRVSSALDEATRDAKELDRAIDSIDGKRVNVTLDIDGEDKIAELEAALDGIKDETVTVEVDTDGVTEAALELLAFKELIEMIDGTDIDVNIDEDFDKDIDRFNRKTRTASDRLAEVKLGAIKLIPALLLLSTALVPLAAVTTAWVAGLVGLVGAVATGLGAVAGFAIPTITDFVGNVKALQQAYDDIKNAKNQKELNKALKEQDKILGSMNPKMKTAVKRFFDLKEEYKDFAKQLQKPVLQILIDGMSLLSTLMQKTFPIAESMATAVDKVVKAANQGLKGEEWGAFFDYIAKKGDDLFVKLMTGFGNILTGFADLIVAFDPLTQDFTDGFVGMTEKFRDWAKELGESKGFHDFVNYVREVMPKIHDFFSALWAVIKDILPPLADLGVQVLGVATNILKLVDALHDNNPALFDFSVKAGLVGAALAPFAPGLFNIVAGLFAMNPLLGLAAVALAAIAGGFIYAYTTNDEFHKRVNETAADVTNWAKEKYGELKAYIESILPALSKAWHMYGDDIMQYVRGMWTMISSIIKGALQIIGGIIKVFLGVITGDWKLAGEGIKGIVKGLWTWIRGAYEGGADMVGGIMNAFRTLMRTIVSGIAGMFVSNFQEMWGNIKDVFTGGIGWVKGKWSDFMGWVRGLKEDIKGAFANAEDWLRDAGQKIIQGLINGLKDMLPDLDSWGSKVAHTLGKFIPGSPVQEGPLKVLNNGYAGGKIIEMLSDGISGNMGLLDKTMSNISTPDMTASAAVLPGKGTGSGGGSNGMPNMSGGVYIQSATFKISGTDPEGTAKAITKQLTKMAVSSEYGMNYAEDTLS